MPDNQAMAKLSRYFFQWEVITIYFVIALSTPQAVAMKQENFLNGQHLRIAGLTVKMLLLHLKNTREQINKN